MIINVNINVIINIVIILNSTYKWLNINVRLSNGQLKKLKDAVSNNIGTTLRISLKMFNGNNLPHELLLTTRQKNKDKKCF